MNPINSDRFGTWLSVVAFVGGFILVLAAGAYTVAQQRHVNQRLCSITIENRESTRSSWQAVRAVLLKQVDDDTETTESQKAADRLRINSFIDAVLLPIPPLRCMDNKPVEDG